MVYSVIGQGFNKQAIINGSSGIYGQPAPNNSGIFDDQSSINYGKNATDNFIKYNQQELGRPVDPNNPPAMNYEVQYLPEKNASKDNLNTMALMGESFEDMGHVNDAAKLLDKMAEKQHQQAPHLNIALDKNGAASLADMNKLAEVAIGKNASYDAYDLNGDGKIDIAENAVATLIKDMTSGQDPNDPKIDPNKIHGKFTNSGDINSNFMLSKKSVNDNRELAKQIYNQFNLGDAMNKFLSKNQP